MADVKVSALPTDSSPTTDDFALSLDSGTSTTKKSSWASLISMFFNNIPATSSVATGWTNLGYTPSNTIYSYFGNGSYVHTYTGVDLTGVINVGTRLRSTRATPAPTQSGTFNGTTQYLSRASASVAGMIFTNNFTVAQKIRPTAYQASAFQSRYNGTSGWWVGMLADGRIQAACYNAGGGNSFSFTSYNSLTLNKWAEIVVQIDMTVTTNSSSTNYIMVNGTDVPGFATRAGTAPTALVQAGNYQIGVLNGASSFFTGNIAQVAVFNAKVANYLTQSYFSQSYLGTEPNLISAYTLSNSLNDLNANANTLTVNGAVSLTSNASPFGTQANGNISSTLDYGVATSVSYSVGDTTVYTQVPEGCSMPTVGAISAMAYSSAKAPYGFPAGRNRWKLITTCFNRFSQNSPTASTAYYTFIQLAVPTGDWLISYQAELYSSRGTAGTHDLRITLDTVPGSYSIYSDFSGGIYTGLVTDLGGTVSRSSLVSGIGSTYNLNIVTLTSASTVISLLSDFNPTQIIADFAYL